MLWSGHVVAQSGTKPNLDATPVPTIAVPADTTLPLAGQAAKPKPSWDGPKLSYSLSAGASFNSLFGAATYLEPSVRYQVSNRFRVNASLAYVNVIAHDVPVRTAEGTTVLYRNNASSNYVASAGVDYLASDRLILSGHIWKNFSNMPNQNTLYNRLNSPGRMGADFKATYKITENFSVTGGVRYTDGASSFNNPYYGPGYGGYYNSPFGGF
nr:hypothetical protein [Pontibacter silvestris]